MNNSTLPIEDIFTALKQQLSVGNAIVVAPPGAGKSTGLPLFLLTLPLFNDAKIIMLQPRRIAARNIALFLAQQLNEPLGKTVGYRVRGESKVSVDTRLEIVTEGVLTRMLQANPELPGVSLIIFDEFHERNLHADFSLALCLEVQQALRDDLKLLVMSATLDVEALGKFMPKAPLLKSEGKQHEVNIEYHGACNAKTIANDACKIVLERFENHSKDWLIFLPGAREIKQCAQLLTAKLPTHVDVLPLFADLKKDEQQKAILPSPEGRQKVVLATNIAETSLTIEGIEVVVDSGLEKTAVFDLKRDLSLLKLQKISQASAIQRAGRAGRLMPGTCYRMWSKDLTHRLARQSTPEILQSDISSLVLEASVWGSNINELALIDPPSKAQQSHAMEKLQHAGVVDKGEKLTPVGSAIHKIGADINIAIMLHKSAMLSPAHQSMACAIAALLENKDPIKNSNNVSIALRLRFLLENRQHPIWQAIKHWHKKLGIKQATWSLEESSLVLALGFVHWIAKHKGEGRFALANGSGASLHHDDDMLSQMQTSDAKWLAIGHMHLIDTPSSLSANAIIRYAEPLPYENIVHHFEALFFDEEQVTWDAQKHRVRATKNRYFQKLLISSSAIQKPSNEALAQAWKTHILQKGIDEIPLGERLEQLLVRSAILNKNKPSEGLFDLSLKRLEQTIDEWLLPFLDNKHTWQQLCGLGFYQLVYQMLSYPQQQALNAALPESFSIPTGRKVNINYSVDGSAKISARMQEFYGLNEHPTLLSGRLPLTIELLSPAQRPLQVTQDIVSFFKGSYREIQKEMKGRYPKHFWPDEPINAPATSMTKKRMS
ncbi:ATP-dependent helicase HrpB [Ningiella sp. W23]|uniref:ATP-dependent helicase HrpB n=1 Tax=Ningiella sp. W23 TaxID=3023715 RepID=UPI003756F88B